VATLEDTIAHDYAALTQRCGLVDASERGKLALTGPDAKDFLHGQVTNDILGLEPGQGCYAAFLTHKGKMLGDLRVLDTERSALQELVNLVRRFKIGRDVELHKRTLERSLFSLIGPRAREVSGVELPEAEHAHVERDRVLYIVTAAGVDVLCDSARAGEVREALVAAGAESCSQTAAEVVRVEAGRPRFGVDLEPGAVIPQEAALNERAVSFTKGCYVGQETVARLFYKGKPNRHLRGLSLSEPVEPGAVLRLGEREVGHVTSPVVSPARGPIALALVRREASPGDTLDVAATGVTARVEELPF
jgi:folate-binding protein YgfZ